MGVRTGKPRGRPPGAKSKRTEAREAQMKAAAAKIEAALPEPFKGDSHALLMTVYKDESMPWPIRIDAAKAAIAYEKPRLAAVELSGNQEKPLAMQVVSGVPREQEDQPADHANGVSHASH